MKKMSFYIIFFLLIVLTGNFMNRYSIKVYNFSTEDFVYTYSVVEPKGRTIEMMFNDFQKWKSLKESRKSYILYRNFKKNYLLFWKWNEYRSEAYKFPLVERE